MKQASTDTKIITQAMLLMTISGHYYQQKQNWQNLHIMWL
jgi:hypothetical protein